MKTKTKSAEVSIDCMEKIDVVEDFSYSGQSEEYITAYKKWRKNTDNPFAYNFSQNSKESVFVDGQGFVHSLPQEEEAKPLKRVLYVIGYSLILYLFIEYAVSKIIVEILDYAGVNIHNSFFNFSVYGGKMEVMSVIIAVNLLKFCVPYMVLQKNFRMPLKVALPCKLQSGRDLIMCIFIGIAVSVITSVSRAYSASEREFFSFFKGYSNEISFMGQKELIIYMLFDIVIVSVMTEFLFSGMIFQTLRQFGNCFAVLTSAFFSAIITHDISYMPATFAISVVSMISILRSGTVFTGVAVRIISRIYIFALTIIETSESEMFLKRSNFMCICLIISLAVICILWNTMPKKFVMIENFKTFLSFRKKVSIIFSMVSTLTLILLCFVIVTINAVI